MQYTVSNGALYILKSVQELVTRLTKPSLGNLAVTAMTSLVCCNWMLLVPRISTGSTAILDLHEWIIQYTSMTTLHRFTPSLMTSMLVQARSQDRMMIHLLSPSLLPSVILTTTSCCYPTSTPSLPQSMFGWFLVVIIDQELKVDGFCMASIK